MTRLIDLVDKIDVFDGRQPQNTHQGREAARQDKARGSRRAPSRRRRESVRIGMGWIEYWNTTSSLLGSERLRDVHDAHVARSILERIPGPSCRVLDFGCGEARNASAIASRCAHLYLCDASEAVRARLIKEFAGNSVITVVTPEELNSSAVGGLDLIVVCSVVQYLSREELSDFLELGRNLLGKGGRLIIADVIPPDVGAVADALELLKFGVSNGVLLDVSRDLVRTVFSDYPGMRARFGLAKYGESEFMELLGKHGYTASRLAVNFGHNQNRMAFVATPRD